MSNLEFHHQFLFHRPTMLTQRGKPQQLFILFVVGLSTVLGLTEGEGPFRTNSAFSEGACLSPEPEGVAKVDEELTNVLETKGFSVAMCSKTYAAIVAKMFGHGIGLHNETYAFSGKFEANRQDLDVFATGFSDPIKMRCEVVGAAKKKCYKLPDKDFTLDITIVWTSDKFKLVVGCTADGYKFWAVFTAEEHELNDDEKKIIFEQLEKLGFNRDMVYEGRS